MMSQIYTVAAALLLASGCIASHRQVIDPAVARTIRIPEIAPDAPGTTALSGPEIQALRIVADDFIPPNTKVFSDSEVEKCLYSQRGYDYLLSKGDGLFYVRIESNPGHCGAQAGLLDAGARYAVSPEGRILKRVFDGEPVEGTEPQAGSTPQETVNPQEDQPGSSNERPVEPLPPSKASGNSGPEGVE